MAEKNMFEVLYSTDVRDRMYTKPGKDQLSYIPWATAWSEVAKVYPDATYEMREFGENHLPYVASDLGIMVYTTVTIEGITRGMCLPVMDGANKALKTVSYTYKVKHYEKGKWDGTYDEKAVEPANMFDINKSIMRCLAKNLAMFGLGLHLWSKEEAPESVIDVENARKEIDGIYLKKVKQLGDDDAAKARVLDVCKATLTEDLGGNWKMCEDLDMLIDLKKALMKLMK